MVTLINHQSYRICQHETIFFFAVIFKDQRLFLSHTHTTHELPIDELKSWWAVFFYSGITRHDEYYYK